MTHLPIIQVLPAFHHCFCYLLSNGLTLCFLHLGTFLLLAGILFKITFANLLLMYRNVNNFVVLILYLAILPLAPIVCRFTWKCISEGNTVKAVISPVKAKVTVFWFFLIFISLSQVRTCSRSSESGYPSFISAFSGSASQVLVCFLFLVCFCS